MLCDGNFLHAVSQMKLGDAKDVVVKYLGSPAKLFTTRCVQHELRGLGAEFKEASFAATISEKEKEIAVQREAQALEHQQTMARQEQAARM